jgi:hypothetical protein
MYILGIKIILNGFGKNNFEHAFLEKRKEESWQCLLWVTGTDPPPPPHWDSRKVAIIAVLADRE